MAIAERELEQAASLELSVDQVKRLGALTAAASKDEARQLLTGVCFRDGEAHATDSYILATLPLVGDLQHADCTLKASELRDVCKRAAKEMTGAQTMMIHLGERVRFEWAESSTILGSIDGDFPNVAQLYPGRRGEVGTIAMNAKTLRRLTQALGLELTSRDGINEKGFVFEFVTELAPVVVKPIDVDNPAHGLIMPVRLA